MIGAIFLAGAIGLLLYLKLSGKGGSGGDGDSGGDAFWESNDSGGSDGGGGDGGGD